MLQHVVGLFDNPSEAQAVMHAIQDAGFSDDAIMNFGVDKAGEVIRTLIGVNFPSADAHAYAEGVQRGGMLIMVRAETTEETNRAIEIINRHNVVDIHRRSDETISVEQRQLDQPISDVDNTAFQEGTFEVRAQDEEVVVDKQVRVVEELIINKEVAEYTETVQDTVRRTDVDVEEMPDRTHTTSYQEPDRISTQGVADRDSPGLVDRIKQAIGLDTDRDDDIEQRDQRDTS